MPRPVSRTPSSSYVYKKYQAMTPSKLKKVCKQQGLGGAGTKQQLVQRLADKEIADKKRGGKSPMLGADDTSSDSDSGSMTPRRKYEQMSAKELKRQCEKKDLSTTGSHKKLCVCTTEPLTDSDAVLLKSLCCVGAGQGYKVSTTQGANHSNPQLLCALCNQVPRTIPFIRFGRRGG